MIPSAHSASAGVGAPYSASIFLLRSSQPGTFGHYIRRNQIGDTAEPDLGSCFTGSFTDGSSQRFYGAVTRVKHNEDVCFSIWHWALLDANRRKIRFDYNELHHLLWFYRVISQITPWRYSPQSEAVEYKLPCGSIAMLPLG